MVNINIQNVYKYHLRHLTTNLKLIISIQIEDLSKGKWDNTVIVRDSPKIQSHTAG